MFGQMCEHGFLVCGLEGGGPPRWEESWSHACGPGVARPSDSQGWGPSLSCFFSLSPTGTDVTLAGGEKNHSDAHFGSHLIGTALLGAGVTHWLHFTGKAEAEATGGSEASWGPGAGPPSLSLGRRLLPPSPRKCPSFLLLNLCGPQISLMLRRGLQSPFQKGSLWVCTPKAPGKTFHLGQDRMSWLTSATFCKNGIVMEGLPGGQHPAPPPQLAQSPSFSGTLSPGTRGKALSFLGTPRTRALMPDS